ncbi:LacI family DNA-binding transcriptional regulator [Paenibacillus sacheonensis]|uniref:Substrate-binding domain-containing protein n=1 Tax=Paenibacillus sacheonensis TaxID=742054 RepID=A0A7X5BWL8_9BACL|nr:LacI family DNA-binding transcriptional regulator [Paenibacillus sacheonensis]NBC69588.1 substrate-binding domain-containing protein [Paenibacillus sacheonensis]
MPKKITTNDISLSLGLSRNTVSKALNDHPSITAETKRKVVEQAIALGYKKLKPSDDGHPAEPVPAAKSIAYITKQQLHHGTGFWMNVISGVEQIISSNGYEMKISFIKNEDIDSLALPAVLTNNDLAGFIVAGSMDRAYTEKLIELPLPKAFININPDLSLAGLKADVVFMENEDSMHQITRHLLQAGHTDIGFIGDISSCRSFMERWFGFQRAHFDAGLAVDPAFCVTSPSSDGYQLYDSLSRALQGMNELPAAFVCVNDKIALHVIKFAHEAGKAVPRDLSVSGFDQIDEAEFLGFTLTTVAVDERQLGQRAAEQLLRRISQPESVHETIRLSTTVVFGESTPPHAAAISEVNRLSVSTDPWLQEQERRSRPTVGRSTGT